MLEVTPGVVATVRLAVPERHNALSIAMLDSITAALGDLAADDHTSVAVIHGGETFCAGLDRKEMQSDDADVRRGIFTASKAFHRAVVGFPKPLISAIDGYAIGTGLDMAVMSDIRITTRRAQMGHPEIALGGVPLLTPLKLVVGDGWARRLCFDSRLVDADLALRIGLVSEVVDDPAQLLDRAMQVADSIAQAPRQALSDTKRLFLRLPDPEMWLTTDHDDVFEQGLTIRRAAEAGR